MEYILIGFMIVLLLVLGYTVLQIRTIKHNIKEKEAFDKNEQVKKEIENGVVSKQMNQMLVQLHASLQVMKEDNKRSQHDFMDFAKDMNRIFSNNKTRGNFGEMQLELLLTNVFGEYRELFSMQQLLKNGTIADCAIHFNDTKRVLCIDSKFPLQNFLRLNDSENEYETAQYEKAFHDDVKKHIDAISSKYITENTMESAIMFLPSEAIYYHIVTNDESLLSYAYKKNVMITSPTTLYGILLNFMHFHKEEIQQEHIEEYIVLMSYMKKEVERLEMRYVGAEKSLQTFLNKFEDLGKTQQKITRHITKIEKEKDEILDKNEELRSIYEDFSAED